MCYGLIGWPLSHSFSEKIHSLLGNEKYRLFPLKEDELDAFLRHKELRGLNVTIPYKGAVIPYCSRLSAAASATGSVNVLKFTPNGIEGYNTDCEGFMYMARRAGISMRDKKVLILGTGATSRTAAFCAGADGAKEIVKISRSGPDSYENISRHKNADILINTTPVGMYPDNGQLAVLPGLFDGLGGVLDVIYNPLNTRLVLRARELGIPASGGLSMLVKQAVAADCIFFGKKEDDSVTEHLLKRIGDGLANIVLIGMPGCGKSSIGRELAARLGREFADLDEEIEKRTKRTPAEIIESDGEEAFRKAETEQTLVTAKRTGLVIACGGGTPLKKENVDALKQNGRIVLIERPLDGLAVAGRPLSVNIDELYKKRLPFYRDAADYIVENTGTVKGAVDKLLKLMEDDDFGMIY